MNYKGQWVTTTLVVLVILFFTFPRGPKIKVWSTGNHAKKTPQFIGERTWLFWNDHRVSGLKEGTTLEDVIRAAEKSGLGVLQEGCKPHWRGGYVIRIIDSWGEDMVVTRTKITVYQITFKKNTDERRTMKMKFEKFGERLQAYLPDD